MEVSVIRSVDVDIVDFVYDEVSYSTGNDLYDIYDCQEDYLIYAFNEILSDEIGTDIERYEVQYDDLVDAFYSSDIENAIKKCKSIIERADDSLYMACDICMKLNRIGESRGDDTAEDRLEFLSDIVDCMNDDPEGLIEKIAEQKEKTDNEDCIRRFDIFIDYLKELAEEGDEE